MPRRDVLAVVLLLSGLAAALLPFARLGLNPHHDGIMLKPALDVLAGQVLFRDTFSQYGALTTYLQVAALRIQPTLLALRLQTIATYALALVFLYAAWRHLLPRWLAGAAGALFILFIPANELDYWNQELWPIFPWSSVFALLFQSVGLYALFQVIRGEQPLQWGLILGLATACAFWCRQPVGALMAGCLVVIWPALRHTGWSPAGVLPRTLILRVLAGFAGIHAVMIGILTRTGAWPEWWYQNVVWPARWSGETEWEESLAHCVNPARFAGLLALLAGAALPLLVKKIRPSFPFRQAAVYYLCLGGLLLWQGDWTLQVLAIRGGGWSGVLPALVIAQAVVSVTQVFTRRGTAQGLEYHLASSLAAFSLASLAQYYPAAEPWHVLWALGPVFGLVAYALWRWSGLPAPVLALLMIAPFVPSAIAKFHATRHALAKPLVTLTTPAVLQGMRVTPTQARNHERTAETLELVTRHWPDTPGVLVGSDALFLCFLPNLANATPYYVTWPGLATEAANAQRFTYIRQVRPLLFFHRADWAGVNQLYRSLHYVPLLYVPEEALEIAVPREMADSLGVKPYGVPLTESDQPSP